MIYLSRFTLTSVYDEEEYINNFPRNCYDSYYPFNFFPQIKRLESMEFSDITILCGSNGSGKSTLLNIIAEKLKLERKAPYNKTYFFDPYLEKCRYELTVHDPTKLKSLKKMSKIITSDDVFNHIIEVREKNENLNFKRELIFKEKAQMGYSGWQGPRGFNTDDPNSIRAYKDYYNKHKQSGSRYVRANVGVDEHILTERTASNTSPMPYSLAGYICWTSLKIPCLPRCKLNWCNSYWEWQGSMIVSSFCQHTVRLSCLFHMPKYSIWTAYPFRYANGRICLTSASITIFSKTMKGNLKSNGR